MTGYAGIKTIARCQKPLTGCDLVPGQVGLEVAVQQQERRPAPACRKVDTGACGLDMADLKARKKVSCPLSVV